MSAGRVLAGIAAGFLLGISPTASAWALTPSEGRFTVVTYNVAGLPEALSALRPARNLPVIGARLNRYDLVLVQEDYAYPELLRQRLALPFVSPGFVPGRAQHFGDGLSLFSRFRLEPARRVPWRACHGVIDAYFDCWAPKGVAMTRAELASGVVVDVYDVHLDAGGSPEDRAARASQLTQLTEVIRLLSGERAFILGGDFNLTRGERGRLGELESALGARDVCAALDCPEPQRLDRILVRSSAELDLVPRSWRAERSFRDARGRPLSDHLPVMVEMSWKWR